MLFGYGCPNKNMQGTCSSSRMSVRYAQARACTLWLGHVGFRHTKKGIVGHMERGSMSVTDI